MNTTASTTSGGFWGYFTARNYELQKSVGYGIDDDNIYQMALTYCQSNPGNDWDDAANHIYDLLD